MPTRGEGFGNKGSPFPGPSTKFFHAELFKLPYLQKSLNDAELNRV